MTAVDADRIGSITHNATQGNFVYNRATKYARERAICCTSVHCARIKQIAAQRTHIEGFEFISSIAEIYLATFHINIADDTMRGSE